MEKIVTERKEETVYRTRGTVVHGFGRGSTLLGYPTANIETKAFVETMKGAEYGVYFGWARVVVPQKYQGTSTISEEVFKTVLSFGKSVQFGATDDTLEAYIMHNYDGLFYDYELRVVICGYIRPMQAFASVQELIQAIDSDVRHAESSLTDNAALAALQHDASLM
uniref:riboflavin kinase n=2 Tax=Lygus hesperus TaxID=30085 RepID=A0A0A9Y7P5_LYGHE